MYECSCFTFGVGTHSHRYYPEVLSRLGWCIRGWTVVKGYNPERWTMILAGRTWILDWACQRQPSDYLETGWTYFGNAFILLGYRTPYGWIWNSSAILILIWMRLWERLGHQSELYTRFRFRVCEVNCLNPNSCDVTFVKRRNCNRWLCFGRIRFYTLYVYSSQTQAHRFYTLCLLGIMESLLLEIHSLLYLWLDSILVWHDPTMMGNISYLCLLWTARWYTHEKLGIFEIISLTKTMDGGDTQVSPAYCPSIQHAQTIGLQLLLIWCVDICTLNGLISCLTNSQSTASLTLLTTEAPMMCSIEPLFNKCKESQKHMTFNLFLLSWKKRSFVVPFAMFHLIVDSSRFSAVHYTR